MRISKDNNKVVDLNKVQYAELLWVCHSFGRTYIRHDRPKEHTVNGHEFDCDVQRLEHSTITMLQYAIMHNLTDIWHPELTLQLSSNHSLVFTGQKALDLKKAWDSKIFGKKKGK